MAEQRPERPGRQSRNNGGGGGGGGNRPPLGNGGMRFGQCARVELLRQAGFDLDDRTGLSGSMLQEALRAADGVIVRSGTRITAELLENPGKLRAIVRCSLSSPPLYRDCPTHTRIECALATRPAVYRQ